MYYIKIKEDDDDSITDTKLIYYCRNCGNEDENISNTNIIVSSTLVKNNEKKFHHIINKYTKQDPTLPRITNIICPNKTCSSNLKSKAEGKTDNKIIYMRYDNKNMKYVYICENCDMIWKNDDF
jgi:DNA-directed RNA polymerase subunit M/transcription elongation factor TFIIS